ncbi:hypothetical protein SUGI_0294450 [Cryptomeria japonica]|uniref:aspartic proteinase NANA, chloroplast n=1 Tax=Cryptomeria japonica TaxID=3369 RepID=UPI002408B88B|nr:aspartic proteinase NANA, chloroplast [Cryptomeria japonica]GLJ17018.1 hypothetical protein SUGI_0294450 [Cryptomeria japonica]
MERTGRGVLKWTFVSVCTLCILLVGFSGVTRNEEKPGRETGLEKRHEPNGGMMRVKLMHKNDHDSPFRKPGETRLESLRFHLRQDRLRLAAFSRSLESTTSYNEAESPEAEAEPPGDSEAEPPGGPDHPQDEIRAPIFSGSFVGSGQYFVDVHIGTPPKRFLLIADTGSDLVWVNCHYHSRTRRRNSIARIFDSGTSSTFSPVSCAAEECLLVPPPPSAPCSLRHPTSCKYMYKYSDRSDSSGVFAYETLTINASSNADSPSDGIRIPSVAMGCSTRRHGQSFHGADGVIGLGQGPISFSSQIGHMYGDKFSYCLVDHLNGPSTSSNYLVFGHRAVDHSLQYTPIQKNPAAAPDTYYYVGIVGVNVHGTRLPIPHSAWLVDSRGNRGSIVDSGTTLTYVLEPGYGILLAAFEQLVCYPRLKLDPFDLCFNSSGIANPRLPDFSIDFDGGASFRPDVDNYFIDAAPDIKCLGILGSSSPLGLNVIGNIMQQNFFIEFDRRNSRLGFARTDCSKN